MLACPPVRAFLNLYELPKTEFRENLFQKTMISSITTQLPNLITWAVLWLASWAIFFGFVYKRVDYIKHFAWTASYFLVTAVITIVIFKEHILEVVQNFVLIPIVVLIVIIVTHIWLYSYLLKNFKKPAEYFEKYPKRTFLQIDFRRMISKSMDLFAQQIFIVLLALFLKDAGLTLGQIIIAFALIFGAVHAPLIIFERGWPLWFFTIFSILSAVIFPILILRVNYGFVYSYIVHWTFYTLMAIVFWILHPKLLKSYDFSKS